MALLSDFADDAHHARLFIRAGDHTAAYFQPVQAAIGPADAMMQALLQRRALAHRLEGALGFGPVVKWQFRQLLKVARQRVMRVKPK